MSWVTTNLKSIKIQIKNEYLTAFLYNILNSTLTSNTLGGKWHDCRATTRTTLWCMISLRKQQAKQNRRKHLACSDYSA